MIDILNLTFPELEAFIVEELGQPRFRAAQVWQWLWQKHATSFDAMTDVSKQLRAKLSEVAEIVLPEVVTVQTSSDGTEKLLLRLRDGALVETVILPSTGQDGSVRIAQCVSSQIGCAMGCTFCSTGTMGFVRNMTAGEILSQVLVARMRLGDNRIDHPIIRNLVFMGMGEPLLNLREVTDAKALDWGMEAPDPVKALSGLSKDMTKIMLSHRPSLAPESAKAGASLQLSGHTHGGLILPLMPLVAAFNGGYVSGMYAVDGMPLYVSNGSGLWGGTPLRLFVPSEITLITLTGAGLDAN